MRIELTLDCCDLERTARFWREAVGFTAETVVEGRYVALTGHGIFLTLQRVPEPKIVKNRMHLDLLVPDVAAEVGRLESLGARRVTEGPIEEFGQHWFVLTDPEGNEFCVAREPTR